MPENCAQKQLEIAASASSATVTIQQLQVTGCEEQHTIPFTLAGCSLLPDTSPLKYCSALLPTTSAVRHSQSREVPGRRLLLSISVAELAN